MSYTHTQVMDTERRAEQFVRLRIYQRQFRKGLEQLAIIDEKVQDLIKRYTRAFHAEMYTLCDQIDLRIKVAENVLNMYAEFIVKKSRQVEAIFKELFMGFKT